MNNRTTKMVGAAGEHFVMYELLRRGFVAALTPEGIPNIDILVSDAEGNKQASIQVKTAGAARTKWIMGKKHETIYSARLFYCFVMPSDAMMSSPSCWIVPSKVVAEHVRTTHKKWLKGTAQRGDTRKDSDRREMHKSWNEIEKYSDGWLDEYQDAWGSLKK